MQERFCLEDDNDLEFRAKANKCLNSAARRVVKDMMSNARIQMVNDYYKRHKGQKMTKKLGSSKLYLREDEYLLAKIDWLNKSEVFRWLCRYWASPAFVTKLEQKHTNRDAGDGVSHRYGLDGHLGLVQHMVSALL